jgi:hypothetical protein
MDESIKDGAVAYTDRSISRRHRIRDSDGLRKPAGAEQTSDGFASGESQVKAA